MKLQQEKLNIELKNNLSFWLNHAINKNTNTFYSSISIDGKPNSSEPIGAMYLSRILYGASTGCNLLNTNEYLNLAVLSFNELQEFHNPKGGYYWAKNKSNVFIHDPENTNMAQAFVLYGLVAFAKIKPSSELDDLINKQFNFIKNTLYDSQNGGYIDGFNENWELGETVTKALGTHLHLLEAFVKRYEFKKDEELVQPIEELITLILKHFITKDTYDCLHRLTPDWKPLDNEIWAGHNAECSWILCYAADAINNENLLRTCNNLALKMVNLVLLKASDTRNGGVYNILKNNLPTENVKIWWPQAETVLALLNCYNITKDSKYQSNAKNLINYISNNFIAPNSEWYTEIYNSGKPNSKIPIIHFWKSMYHTVRYYEMITILSKK